jgi:hypothetical protein
MLKNAYLLLLCASLSFSILAPSFWKLLNDDTVALVLLETNEEESHNKGEEHKTDETKIFDLDSVLFSFFYYGRKGIANKNLVESIPNDFSKIYLPPPKTIS